MESNEATDPLTGSGPRPASDGRQGDGVDPDGAVDTTGSRQGSLAALGDNSVARIATTDVGAHQRRARLTRFQRLSMVLAPIAVLLVLKDLFDPSATIPTPHLPASMEPMLPAMGLIIILALVMVVPLLAAGRSPHILYRPEELTTTFDDVRGSEGLVEEVTKTLNLFLAHRTFAEQMGGSPRKAILFEGPPGTGKTYMAKAMAGEAGVPFLFVSSSAFQSMFYGQTNRKIRSYFKALRRHARREGGAIGFIEELDAIGGARGTGAAPRRGHPRRGQRAADPAPVLRADTGLRAAQGHLHRRHQRLAAGPQAPAQATDRPGQHPGHRRHQPGRRPRPGAAAPGPLRPHHLLRPAGPSGRRDIIDYYLGKKAHEPDLDDPARRDTLAATDRRLLAGDDRAPDRRVAGVGAPARGATGSRGTTSSRPR